MERGVPLEAARCRKVHLHSSGNSREGERERQEAMEMCDFLYPYLLAESHCRHVESRPRMRDVCAWKCVYHLDWEKVLPPEERLGNSKWTLDFEDNFCA